MFRKVFFALILLFPVGSVQAQPAIVLQKLNEWNVAAPAPDNGVLKAQILTVVAKVYRGKAGCAQSPVEVDTVQPATADGFVFPSVLNQQMRNAWIVTARLPACDSVPARYMVMQMPDGSFQTIRVNRGESYAWSSLIDDTLPLVDLAARAALDREGIKCGKSDPAQLGVTRIAWRGKDLGAEQFGIRYVGTWGEVWPYEICGRTVEVAIDFTADGDGGAYNHIPGRKVAILPK